MPIDRRRALVFIGLLAGAAARGQGAFPQRPVRFVVPNAPGGPSDIVARTMSGALAASLGQPIVVDNRPGASGLIGTGAVVSALADGYTVLVTSRSNHVLAPLVQKSAAVDPQRDLAPIGLALRAVGMFVTTRESGFTTLKSLVERAKANPGKLNYGSAGIGATNHIAVEQFKALAGIDLVHVPYKGGGPLISALMAGEVQFALLDFASAQTGIKSGNVVPLAQTGKRRLSSAPMLPTLAESGFADFDASFWIGLAAPRHTPVDVIGRLNQALNAALADTRVKAYAQANGWELVGGPPQVLADTVTADFEQFPPLLARLDIKAS